MDMMPVKPERKAQLEEYARRHGQDAAAALEWERQEYDDTVAAVLVADEEVKAGRGTTRRGSLGSVAREAWPSALRQPRWLNTISMSF
jgi:hypothetical protein